MKLSPIYVFILIIPSESLSKSQLKEYCSMPCKTDKPVMCRRQREKCQLAAACQNLNKNVYITAEEKHLITHLHNKFRNQMALGLYNDLKATDMQEILWNDELEGMAGCWGNTCQVRPDRCIRTLGNQEVGQNVVLLNSSHLSRGLIVALEIAVQHWFDQRNSANLGADQINNYNDYLAGASSSFTRVIWAKTVFVGCGRTFMGAMREEMFLACNYFPAGNIYGEKIYTIGNEPCSQCTEVDGHKSGCTHEWTSLCNSSQFKTKIFYETLAHRNEGFGRCGIGSVSAMVCLVLNLFYIIVRCIHM